YTTQRWFSSVVSTGVLAVALGLALDCSLAQADPKKGDGIGKPKFTRLGSVTNFSPTAKTIPFFSSQFTDPSNGRTYPYTMVGTNPGQGDATTVVPTVIIPFSFNFDASSDPSFHVLDGSTKALMTTRSP